MHKLAISQTGRYSCYVPEKKGNEFSSSTGTGRIGRAKRLFHACFIAPFLWAAVAGRLRPAGFLVHRSANPAICCPPRLAAGRSSETYKEPAMRTNKKPVSSPKNATQAANGTSAELGELSPLEQQAIRILRMYPSQSRELALYAMRAIRVLSSRPPESRELEMFAMIRRYRKWSALERSEEANPKTPPSETIPLDIASGASECMEVIENSHVNLGLLMTEIRNKVESCSWENPHDSAALQSILCFTDCAQLNVSQIREKVCTLSDLITPLMPEAAHV